jgi:uncharacterized protein involved in cysteine biosynthesis|tara:strand:- start:3227 stop:3565 length:339 start_codon:yes stop_codon:yes gene_type:complete
MNKFLITLTIVLATLWIGLTSFMNSVMADEYDKAVIGHVIQSKVNGINVDTSKLLEYEMQKLAHNLAIESLTLLQAYLPAILDAISADLRLQADLLYKCNLLEDTKIKDDCK